MKRIDVFHGDADGLCSLRQLRMVAPADAVLITGAKRHVSLLEQAVAGPGDEVTVLDLPLDRNRTALAALLEKGVRVQYFDHHASAEAQAHPRLTAVIDASPGVCTGVLVDRFVEGRYREWAVVAAFGDNLGETAQELSDSLKLGDRHVSRLRILGEFLNYNSYGESEADLIVHPCELYRVLCRHWDPLGALEREPLIDLIAVTRCHDLDAAWQCPALEAGEGHVYLFPDKPWSRRVRGSFANELSKRWPEAPHAVLVEDAAGDYMVSVRAPRTTLRGADVLCARFPGGGGRAAAAGINHLPRAATEDFLEAFRTHSWLARPSGTRAEDRPAKIENLEHDRRATAGTGVLDAETDPRRANGGATGNRAGGRVGAQGQAGSIQQGNGQGGAGGAGAHRKAAQLGQG